MQVSHAGLESRTASRPFRQFDIGFDFGDMLDVFFFRSWTGSHCWDVLLDRQVVHLVCVLWSLNGLVWALTWFVKVVRTAMEHVFMSVLLMMGPSTFLGRYPLPR